jgi:membrane protein implicated in regulation of membrane protease activity
VQLPVALLPALRLLCSVVSVSSVVVLLLLLLRQRRTTENTEDTETRQQGSSSKQRPGDAMQRVAVGEPKRDCAAGDSSPSVGESTGSPQVIGVAPAGGPRSGSARFP